MARPNNSIANVKLPGENTQRPIVPYAVGVNSNNSYQAILPTLTADDTIVIGSIVANEYVAGSTLTHAYVKGDYCKHDGFLYRAKESTMGTWDATKWEKVDIGSQLNLLQYGVYSPSDYGYNKEGVTSLVGPILHINQAEDHEDYMVEFSSREGTAPNWSFYSTKIYPGKITINDIPVVVQTDLDDYVVGPASSTNNNIALFDGTTGKLIKSDDKINYSYTESSDLRLAETSLNLSRTYTISGRGDVTEIAHYRTDGIEQEFYRNGEVVTRYAYLFPSQGGTIALTSDLTDFVKKTGAAQTISSEITHTAALKLKTTEDSSTHEIIDALLSYIGYGSGYSSTTNLKATYTSNVSDIFNIYLPAKSGTLSLEIDIVDLTL